MILQSEDGRENRRTREHLRGLAPQLNVRPSTSATYEVKDVEWPAQELRRSSIKCDEPYHYTLPERIFRNAFFLV